jgi:hypothetical protein
VCTLTWIQYVRDFVIQCEVVINKLVEDLVDGDSTLVPVIDDDFTKPQITDWG